MGLIYKLLQWFCSILVGVFYSEIEVRGIENIPDSSQPVSCFIFYYILFAYL